MQVNSYVSDRRKKRKQRRKYLLGALATITLYLLLWGIQWFVFRSPFFRVDHIVVQGNNSVASADIISLVESSALQNHNTYPAMLTFTNMMLWPSQISQNSLNMVPDLQSVDITKDYFTHTITINVSERIPFGVWCYSSNNNCYWFDDNGIIFERSLETAGDVVYVVQDHSQTPNGLNQKILPDEFLDNFISIVNVLRQAQLPVKEIDLNDIALEEVDVQVNNGPTIYFSLRFAADNYLGYIQKLMLEPNFSRLQYIDCRTENRLYYK